MYTPPGSIRGSSYVDVVLPRPWQLSKRQLIGEIMDDPGLDAVQHLEALRGLRRINQISLVADCLWSPIERLALACRDRSVRVLDLATGGGDIPIALARRASRAGLTIEIAGCDVNERALDFARSRATAAGADVEFFSVDVMRDPIPSGFDVICASLFLHHLEDAAALELLKRMATATSALVLISDLRRGVLAYCLARTAARMLTRSRVVRVDGPLSVAAAFTIPEIRDLMDAAGLDGASVRGIWPMRFFIEWSKHES